MILCQLCGRYTHSGLNDLLNGCSSEDCKQIRFQMMINKQNLLDKISPEPKGTYLVDGRKRGRPKAARAYHNRKCLICGKEEMVRANYRYNKACDSETCRTECRRRTRSINYEYYKIYKEQATADHILWKLQNWD